MYTNPNRTMKSINLNLNYFKDANLESNVESIDSFKFLNSSIEYISIIE